MQELGKQVGGNHYKGHGIQPFELSHANDHGSEIHAIQKYVTRHRRKAGKVDLEKAIHICEIRVELIAAYGADAPRHRRVNIEEYIASNSLNAREGAIVRMVESWHMVTDIDHEKTAELIQKQLRLLIEEHYPETKETT